MNQKLNVILCAGSHLPLGCGDDEFEALYNREIKPLVSALNKFPRINIVLHFSGVVLNWIERHKAECFMLLEDLIQKKQIEFLGGGFYYPALPLLPTIDKIGQIDMLSTYLRKQFGKRPQGCWLPSLTWEQNLAGPLLSCGMNYTFLEDWNFSGAGVKPGECGIFPPCVTEDQGKLITVFPVVGAAEKYTGNGNTTKLFGELLLERDGSETKIPVLPVGAGILSKTEAPSAEGEKSEIGYEGFFEELSAADPRVEFVLAAKIVKNLRGLRKVYFSGQRTGKDSGADGIHPRRFIAEYPEAGNIYAKTIYVHTLINNQLRGDKTRKRTALEELWKAQDSSLFRSGSAASPGLFHAPARKAAYRSLLESEKITREKGKFSPSLSFFDFDLDGEGECVFQDDKINFCVKPRGAGIFELDYLKGAWNYLDTLGAECGERRCAFTDWFAPAGTLPEAAGGEGIPGGRFCGSEEYEISELDRIHRRANFHLSPKTGMFLGEIEIEKIWQLKKNTITLEYVLKNSGSDAQSFCFCSSLDLSFSGGDGNSLRIFSVREGKKENLAPFAEIVTRNCKNLEFQDIKNEAVITLETSRAFDAKIFHIQSGFPGREEYQSTCVTPIFQVSLEEGKIWKALFSLKISS